jgi:acetyltransferase-like isoleucine patch superfamily enzyme
MDPDTVNDSPELFEDINHLRGSKPTYSRPVGLGKLGTKSFFIEPYKIRSPHRVHIGNGVLISERACLSVVEEHMGGQYDPALHIGDNTLIGPDFLLACSGEIVIGSNVGISSRAFIGDCFRAYEDPHLPYVGMPVSDSKPVRIGDGCALGVGAIVLPGVTIGERAVVAAGSVVTRDVPPRAVVFGNPARVVRSWDEESGQWRTGG